MTEPPKRKPSAGKQEGSQDSRQQQPDFKTDGDGAQAVAADPFARFRAVWAANITPTGRKLVLLALADFADADGTNIRPSVATVAARCTISPNQARVHIGALVVAGVIKLTKGSAQHRAATYALDFEALAGLQWTGALNNPRAPVHKFQGSSPRASGLQSTGDDPGYTRGKTTPGVSGSGFAGPGGRGKVGAVPQAQLLKTPPGETRSRSARLIAEVNA